MEVYDRLDFERKLAENVNEDVLFYMYPGYPSVDFLGFVTMPDEEGKERKSFVGIQVTVSKKHKMLVRHYVWVEQLHVAKWSI